MTPRSLSPNERQQIARQALAVRDNETMWSVLVYVELATANDLGGLSRCLVDRINLVLTSVDD
jgi:hypothetical protein